MNDPFSYAIIGKAMEVHRALGPGVDEVFYHNLLSERLRAAGIEHLSRPREQLIHRGIVADTFEADLVFPVRMIAELKCLRGSFDPESFVQLICYLKFWRVPAGLLFDFAKDSLLHQRVNYEPVQNHCSPGSILADAPNLEAGLESVIAEGIVQILIDHGLGYRDTTYRGLLSAEFNASGIGCIPTPTTPVSLDGRLLGETRCDCLVVGKRLGIQVLALRRAITAADIAVLRTHLRLLDLPHGLIVNFGKTAFEHRWINRPIRSTQRFGEDKD